MKSIGWYVPCYDSNIAQQAVLLEHIFSMAASELHYNQGSVFVKDVNIQFPWKFELGVENGVEFPF